MAAPNPIKLAVDEFNDELEHFDRIPAAANPGCVEWVAERILFLLKLADPAVINAAQTATITEFLEGEDDKKRTLFAYLTGTAPENVTLKLTIGHPMLHGRSTYPEMSLDVLYFVRTDPKKTITAQSIEGLVNYGSVRGGQAMETFLRNMQSVLAPTLLRNTAWPDSIQKEFGGVIHKFMATLTETANRLKGKTVLYVPMENIDDETTRAAHLDKELVQRFETAVIHWTRQIREVVNEKDVEAASESEGPLAEIQYWRARTRDLNNIRKQFTREDVLRIVEVLHRTKTSQYYLEPFLNQKADIENGTEEAIDNLKYLKTLEAPCRKLAEADPKDIPALIPNLLKIVQMIFIHSKHYKKDRFYRLLRMISNEIVRRCRTRINLQAIFDGQVELSMVALQQSVEAGEVWIQQCRKMLSATAKRYRTEKAEQLEIDETIFSEIESFVKHRCMNLQEVCKGQQQFGFRVNQREDSGSDGVGLGGSTDGSGVGSGGSGSSAALVVANAAVQDAQDQKRYAGVLPCFGGAKGPEIESQLFDIQRAFKAKMDALRKLSYDILDVKATMWSDDYRLLKAELDNLGTMMTQIIQTAFDLVATVEGGAELLEAFHYLAKREELERAVDRRKDDVIKLFSKELSFVQKESQRYHKKIPILFLHPPSAGQAYWFRGFQQRIGYSYRLLHRCWYLNDSSEKTEAFATFAKLEKSTFMETLFADWKKNLPANPGAFLDTFLIARKDADSDASTLMVNFASELRILFEEVRYWQRLGEAIPQHIAELIQKEEKLRVSRENVCHVVRAYNNIINSLNPEERRLFAHRIAFLDSKYAPGLNKLWWSSQGIVEYFVRECRAQSERIQLVVDDFKHGTQYTYHLCHVIADTLVVSIEKKRVYQVPEFESRQEQHRELIKKKLRKCHEEILLTMKRLFDHLRQDYANDQKIRVEWHRFVEKIDKEIEDSLKTMVKRSLQEIEKALGSTKEEDKRNEGPLFVLEVDLFYSTPDTKPTAQTNPSLGNLSQKMIIIAKEVINVVAILPRLEEALTNLIDNETDVEIPVKHQSPYADGQFQGSYHDLGESENLMFVRQIQSLFNVIAGKVKDELDVKMSSADYADHSMWSNKEQMKTRAYSSWKTLSGYTDKFANSKEVEKVVSGWDTMVDRLFIRLDYRRLKAKIRERLDDWVKTFLQMLHIKSTTTLDGIYKYFQTTVDKLRKAPRTLDNLSEALALCAKVTADLQVTESSFEPLSQQYAVLESNSWQVREEELKMKHDLPTMFEEFQVKIEECRKQLDKHKEQFKSDLEGDLRTFASACEALKKDLNENGPYQSALQCSEAFVKIADYKSKLAQRRDKENQLKQGIEMFKLQRPPQNDLKDVQGELELLTKIWEMCDKWKRETDTWKTQPFKTLCGDDMTTGVEVFRKDVMKLRKELERRDVWSKLKDDVDLFKRVLPVVDDLLNPAIRPRHWRQLMAQLEEKFDPDSPEFCLQTLLTLHAERQAELVSNLSTAARQELKIELDIKKIDEVWSTAELAIEVYRDSHKISSVEDISTALTEHITMLSSMKMSRFVENFKTQVQDLEQKLSIMTDTLEALLLVQTKWMYLENIFVGSEDIKRKLVEETKLFNEINSQWKNIMMKLHDEPNVMRGTTREHLLENLNRMSRELEKIQKSLEAFLEDRRRAFPRFYFLSNDDLLEILGHTKEPNKVQPHLRKCFEGLFRLDLVEQKKGGQMVARQMFAADGEKVPFTTAVQVEGLPVEVWLKRVEDKMKDTMKHCLVVATNELQNTVFDPKARKIKIKVNREALQQWIFAREGQCIITASSINWTYEVERVINMYHTMGGGGRRKKSPVYKLYKKWKILIRRYCELVRGKMDKLQRNKLVALITIEVHARDILRALQAAKVSSITDFDWTKQLRFYLEDEVAIARQTSASVKYDYEYLGNSGRLVVTGLTDRAYMTLTTALQLYRGGLPQGPAGTGKTETVKDLGKAIAKYVMVFNCSDGLDYKSLGRMLSGIAQTGGWSCFDEFNRIEVEVLSVVAQQIHCILTAVAEQRKAFLFEGIDIPLNTNCGVFVTMNPGYAGRSELPDNLKALLRPISMMTPDFTLICEITLLSQGFESSSRLALKVSILYELMEKQLSKQDHYDFSLRNIKAVLVQAGNLKRENFPGDEEQLCLKACSDMNLPKFVKDDVPLFQGMLRDLFPRVVLPGAGLESLRQQGRIELEARGLEINEHILLKVLHLWDTLNTRHGVMVVGQTGSGKTVTWQTLSGALKRMKDLAIETYEPVKVQLVNPKAVTMDELYGSYNQATREWKDGILSDIMRQICRDETPLLKWILFDGPVDTLWIESMNTVLDDNKMLTLNSGERINLTPQVSMVFEVQDLSQASPATVSRCGMVFFNVEDLGWKPFINTWLRSRKNFEISINGPKPEVTINELKVVIDQFLGKALEFRKRECVELFPTTDIAAARSFTTMFDAIANPDAPTVIPGTGGFSVQSGEHYLTHIKMLATFSMIWAIGGTLTEESRRKFDVVMREIESTFPSSETCFEYYVDYRTHTWRSWEEHPDLQRPFSPPEETPYYRLMVPTVDTIRYRFVVASLIQSKVHCVLVGNTGTGKSLVAAQAIRDMPAQTHMMTQLNFSAQTSAKNVQDIIEGRMEHKSKKVYSPPGGRRMVCLVEDLNMPAKEKFGAQPPLELLRQWIDNGSWFDRNTQTRRQINDMQLVCCMTFGRPAISQRLLSKLNVLNITFPSDAVISKIFLSILSFRFQRFSELLPYNDLLVKATVQVYSKVTTDLLPIPSKSHYLYNLRDLSKVFQGIFSAHLEAIETKEQLFTLWMHEVFRVFSDRMNDLNDKTWFRNLVVEKLETLFQTKWRTLLRDGRNPIFVDFWEGDFDEMAKYKLTPGNAELKKKLEDQLENFNNEPGARAMNLVFFGDAMEHLCRIHRIIRQPRGNALLVGLGGSGRSSLTRLAAYLAGYSVFSIEIHKKYDLDRFHDDLRTLFRTCGGPKKLQRVFYFSDNQIMEPSFLEDINNMLSVGEVPNLFPKDDVAMIKDEVRKDALEAGCKDTIDEIFAFFIDRARKNLHLVVAMSPAHKLFRLRLRQFPALVSCTTIDWFVDWPSDALKEVAMRFLGEVDVGPPERQEAVADMFVSIHDSTNACSRKMKEALKRFNYVTPSSYLDLVRGYVRMMNDKRAELCLQRDKLQNGMAKLDETKEAVGKMTADLKIQEEKLRIKTSEVDGAMTIIKQRQQVADDKAQVLEVEKRKIEKEKAQAEQIAADAQADLDKAMPALNEATAALDALQKSEIQEMKAYIKPPPAVQMVMSAVQTALKRPQDWEESKKSLNDPKFLEGLKNYGKNEMSDKMLSSLEKFVKMPDFKVDKVQKVSGAAGGLCLWVIAMHRYGLVYKEVAPKQAKLAAAVARVAHQEEALRVKQESLDELIAQVRKLEEDLQSNLSEKKMLQQQAKETEDKLKRANIIVSGLEGERDVWTKSIERFEMLVSNIVGDALLASGFSSYTGAFTADYRAELLTGWIKEVRKSGIPMTKSWEFVDFLVDPTEVRDWQNAGLPGDDFSRENAVMVTRGSRWPLMIDPQQQANKWIKRMEKELKVVDPKQADYMKTIEYAVQFGHPVLLQDILEEIDPSLDSVVSKAIIKKAGRSTIKIGDNFIEYNDKFKLYITTRMANPHYTPETCTKVCLLNFAVKEQGLEEQLLKIVVEKEKPEVEEQNERLILSTAAAKKEKKRLEDELLNLLAQSDQSLLDNHKLISTLQISKQTQIDIEKQLKEADKVGEEITKTRNQYRECAKRASILFFVLSDLGSIDSMYQFALDSYIVLFQMSIERSREKIRVDTVEQRVEVLNDWHTGQVYNNTCRGLFEKHKLLFSFHMTVRILAGDGRVNLEEFAYFIKGGQVLDKEAQPPNPASGWLSEKGWDNIYELDKLLNFHGIAASFEAAPQDWKVWYLAEKPEEALMPSEWQTRIADNYLQRMLVVRCVRPDRVVFMVQRYIEDMLDKKYVDPPPFNLNDTFEESKNILPLVFVLSPGVDPTTQLNGLAERRGRPLRTLALGQGQGPFATKLILDSAQTGGWVFLANCHLMVSWLVELEKMIDNLPNLRPHEHFRLWLSSTPTPQFPIGILQKAVKMTTEPPTGIRANMSRLYNYVSEQQFMKSSGDRPHLYRPLLFVLCYFHTLLLERRKFGTLGYNVVYDFNYSDFEVSENILARYITDMPDAKAENMPLTTMRYLIAEASYGGRVTDDWDRRVINTYMDQFMTVATVTVEGFKLSSHPDYYVPPESPPMQSYRDFCVKLPLVDAPEAFGQHSNADIASQIANSNLLLDSLMGVNATLVRGGGGGGSGGGSGGAASGDKAAPQTVEERLLSILSNLDEQVPELIDYAAVVEATHEEAGQALNTCLLQEIQRYNALLAKIHRQRKELRRAVKGEIVMNDELEAIFNAILVGKVAQSWQSGYPSSKPLASWGRDLVDRVEQMNQWSRATPKVFWLAGFTYPTGFLKSLQQQSARRDDAPIDEFGWEFFVLPSEDKTITTAARDGSYIRGIYLEGAAWDPEKTCLQEPQPMSLIVSMPIIHFRPKRREGGKLAVKSRSIYVCPLYMYPIRTGTRERPSFVLAVDLATGKSEPEHWTKRGTALLLSTDE